MQMRFQSNRKTSMIAENSKNLFDDAGVVDYYTDKKSLIFGEAQLLEELSPSLQGARILDLGVGAGRTTPFFLSCFPMRYVGVDCAPNMISRCQECFPGQDFRVGDARDLSEFQDGDFDFVMFSWSGIDYVDHAGRESVISEVFRVLRPGGSFAFATANGRKLPSKPWSLTAIRNMEFSTGPRAVVYGLKEWLRGCWNYLSRARHEFSGDGYNIRIDQAHNFSMIRYFITPERQAAQLERIGFTKVFVVDRFGKHKVPHEPDIDDTSTLYYCCTKPG